MPKKNEWASRFGARRRALDKAYCQAAEQALAVERREDLISFENEEAKRIARAFGRPLK